MTTTTEDFTPESLVLVTGANGHVAQHVISQLLSRPEQHRPRVRATVRAPERAADLEAYFKEDVSSGRFEIAYVPDMLKPGAFDQAVKECTHIAHIASPLVVGAKDAENEVIIPAVRGTTSLLQSALKVESLRAVVVTGSMASVMDPMHGLRPRYTYTPKDWNPITYEQAVDPNLDISRWPEKYRVFITYMASKKLAEKAAWDFVEGNKTPWRFSMVNLTYIGGPSVLPLAKGAASLSFSQGLIWRVAASAPDEELTEVDFPHWVDVRDVAKAHILALTTPGAAGQRFILAPHKTTYARMAETLRRHLGMNCSKADQELDAYDVNSKNCETILGFEDWVTFDEWCVIRSRMCTHSMESSQRSRGDVRPDYILCH